ncbi:alanyl-tRNA editing protein AlaX [archaeon]|nr:alanyl-tRNA editing protein AlaX [archaeon]|tara:strand:- start:524 stop:1234 length:711 start_codon:yes stop_codon:yes gene_type:complete
MDRKSALYFDDSYLREFTAVVKEVNDKFIVLDRTAFFPIGGGVLNDVGKIFLDDREFEVVYVIKKENKISHEVSEEGLKVGDNITGKIEWDNRYLLMRYHTAAHVLSGLFSKELKCLITGNQLNLEKGRIDLDLENFSKEKIQKYIDKANEIIEKDLKVKVYYLSKEEAKKDEELFKLAMNFKHEVDEIRIVEIEDFDKQADGGCHVKSLKEIGKIELLKIENKGKNNRRVYFKIL